MTTGLQFPGAQSAPAPGLPAQQGLQPQANRAASGALAGISAGLAQQGPGSLRQASPTGLQAMGAQVAGAQQQAQTNTLKLAVGNAQQDAEGELQDEKLQQSDALQQTKLAISRQGRDLSQALAIQSATAQQELFSSNMQFEKDELGRTMFNERQLADYAIQSAKTAEDLANYEQQVAQTLERKRSMTQAALAVIVQAEKQSFESEQQSLDIDLQRRITLAKKRLADDLARLQADAANTAAMWGGVTAVGAAITPIFPVAGLAIAGVGAAGQAYSAQQTKKQVGARQAQGNTI